MAFGIWVFLQVLVLTIPKFPVRKAAIELRAEGRSRVWRQQLERQGAAAETRSRSSNDWLLIGGVTAGGGLVVLALALAALRRPARMGGPGSAGPTPRPPEPPEGSR